MSLNISNSKYWNKKVVLILLGALIIFGGIGASALTRKPENHQAKVQASDAPAYQYAYLGDKCRIGLANYQQLAISIDAEATKAINDTQQQANIAKSNSEAAVTEFTSQYDYYKTQYDSATGDIDSQQKIFTVMSYFTNQIVQAQNDSKTKPLAILQAGQANIDKLAASKKVVTDREARLSACIDAVDRKQNFSVTEASDIEAFFAQSNTKP